MVGAGECMLGERWKNGTRRVKGFPSPSMKMANRGRKGRGVGTGRKDLGTGTARGGTGIVFSQLTWGREPLCVMKKKAFGEMRLTEGG